MLSKKPFSIFSKIQIEHFVEEKIKKLNYRIYEFKSMFISSNREGVK